MTVRSFTTGQIISLLDRLAQGGEGVIYRVPGEPSLLAKVYHTDKITLERSQKLEIMLKHPPKDPMAAKGHASIAWPRDLLVDLHAGQVIGFTMPYAREAVPIFNVYNPSSRLEKIPHFNYRYLVRTARNLCAAVQSLHDAGYVVGDLNESNILVTEEALVTVVDTDSFQVRDLVRGKVFRCPVGKPEFTPPELQGSRFKDIDRLPEHDSFALSVILFLLLMEGAHPYDGIYTGRGEPPLREENIKFGYFAYDPARKCPVTPRRTSLPLDFLPKEIASLFIRAFVDGKSEPSRRPKPSEWIKPLEEAERYLKPCSQNVGHYYWAHLTVCPWCERKSRFNVRDPFPSPVALVSQYSTVQQPLQIPLPSASTPVSRSASTPVSTPSATTSVATPPVSPPAPSVATSPPATTAQTLPQQSSPTIIDTVLDVLGHYWYIPLIIAFVLAVFFVRSNQVSTNDNNTHFKIIGNKNTKYYHLPNCSWLPASKNQVKFPSREEAERAGYRPHSCIRDSMLSLQPSESDKNIIIGNKNSRFYHNSNCEWLPAPENQVRFRSASEAEQAGYHPHSCINND